jgi:hypothetical protein
MYILPFCSEGDEEDEDQEKFSPFSPYSLLFGRCRLRPCVVSLRLGWVVRELHTLYWPGVETTYVPMSVYLYHESSFCLLLYTILSVSSSVVALLSGVRLQYVYYSMTRCRTWYLSTWRMLIC